MLDTAAPITEFADAVKEKMRGLTTAQAIRVKALTRRQVERHNPFDRGTVDLHANLSGCLADNALATLAATAHLCALEAKFGVLVADRRRGDHHSLPDVGSLIADGDRDDLNGLVEDLCPGGWSDLDASDVDPSVQSPTIRCRIAAEADKRLNANDDWLSDRPLRFTSVTLEDRPGRLAASPMLMPTVERPSVVDEAEPAPMVAEHNPADSSRRLLPTVASILKTPPRAREQVFGTMVERGVASMLAAVPGIGKTTFGLEVACAVASGANWGGFAVGRPADVMYLNAEDSHEEVKRRFAAANLAGRLSDGAAGRIHLVDRFACRLMTKEGGSITATEDGVRFKAIAYELRPR